MYRHRLDNLDIWVEDVHLNNQHYAVVTVANAKPKAFFARELTFIDTQGDILYCSLDIDSCLGERGVQTWKNQVFPEQSVKEILLSRHGKGSVCLKEIRFLGYSGQITKIEVDYAKRGPYKVASFAM